MTQLLDPPAAPARADGPGELDELDDRALLDASTEALRARRLAQVAEMRLAAHWADRHGAPRDDRDPMTQPGGEGTPEVCEAALPELGMARDEHALSTRSLVADTLDLRHRLPLTWRVVEAGECEPWVARKVAVLSRPLSPEGAAVVDRAVARAIRGHAPSTVLEIAAAAVVRADPERHAEERRRARHERYVTLSRSDEFGFRHVIAKVTAGDAAWIDAMVDRVADVLAAEHGHDHNRDELRSAAMGWLARPADLLKLLLDHTEPDRRPEQPAWAPDHLSRTVERLCALPPRRLAALRGRGVVFVHLTDSALRRQSGVCRVEGQGPMLVQCLGELLGHADVALKPVVDHRVRHRADAYEHDEAVKDRVWTRTGGDVFPFSPRTATRDAVDFDHTIAYVPPDRGGPPGQTGDHNSGPLRRRHHRWKTHGGYRCRDAGAGRHLWQTPHGLCLLVDGEGTRRLDDWEAELMLTAPPGVEIHLQPRGVEFRYGRD